MILDQVSSLSSSYHSLALSKAGFIDWFVQLTYMDFLEGNEVWMTRKVIPNL